MIKALLCDFDGTLANTLWFYPRAYRETLNNFGFKVSDKWIIDNCFGKKEEDICKKLGISDEVEKFRSLYFKSANSYAFSSKLFRGVIDILKEISNKNIKLAILSFARRNYILKMIDKLKLEYFFQIVIAYEDVANPKPAPDAVFKVCEIFGITPSESLIIGDSRSDILMGKNAGAKTVLFFPKEHEDIYNLKILKQTNPDFIINNWDEVRNII